MKSLIIFIMSFGFGVLLQMFCFWLKLKLGLFPAIVAFIALLAAWVAFIVWVS